MTSIKLTVRGADAKARVSGPLTGGMVGIPVVIEYDSSWEGLTITLVCRSDAMHSSPYDTVRTVANVGTEAVVAHEVMIAGRTLFLGVEGRNADGTLVIPTVWANCGKIKAGADGSADPTADPTLPVWAQIIAQMGSLEDLETEDASSLVAAINEALTTGGSGTAGKDGRGIVSVLRTGGSGAAGTVDTYTITYTDGTTSTFKVRNGADGADGADGYTPVKGVDYYTEEDKTEMVEQMCSAMNGIPDYWQSALDDGVKAINMAMLDAGCNKSAFLFYTDAHWNYGSQMSPVLLKYLYQHTGVCKTFFGGDIVNDEADDYDTMSYLWEWRNQLKDLPNHHSVVGNHDDGNTTNNRFSEKYVYGYLLAAEETPDLVRGDSGLYYYVDSQAEKTRYLCLDTAYKGVDSAQLQFVSDALKGTPDGWHIVAVSHIWYDANYDVTPPAVGDLNSGAAQITALLDSYNSRSGDYAGCGGWVEFCIGGHTHWDYDNVTTSGIPVILCETDSRHVRSGLDFTLGTTTESSVNAIVADYDAHKINMIRIGRGESREVEVTNYVVSYTNVLSSALDADGVSIYNGVGYKADVRWSTSGQAESESAGIYLTGWIPVRPGDVIYVKNISMDQNTTVANTCIVLFSSAVGSTFETLNAENLTTYCGAQWDEDGILTQFTIQNDESYQYIRLQAGYIGSDSIITIGEIIP